MFHEIKSSQDKYYKDKHKDKASRQQRNISIYSAITLVIKTRI